MPRTTIDAQSPLGSYPVLPLSANSADVVWTGNTDPTDRETPLYNGKTLVLAQNSDVSPHTITFTSVADQLNRPGDITAYSIGAGETAMFGPFQTAGWAHSSQLWIDVSDPTVLLAVLRLP